MVFKNNLIWNGSGKFDSALFDLDGTLWDSREILANAWTEILHSHNIRSVLSVEKLTPLFGNELSYVIRHSISENVSDEIINSIIPELAAVQVSSVSRRAPLLYHGVKNTLKELSKYVPVFIVSNSVTGYIDEFIKLSNTREYITDFICSEDTGFSKGENIKLIIKKYGLVDPVYVGDTIMDFDACKYSNIKFIYASYGFGEVKNYDFYIESVADILNIIIRK